MTDDTVTFVPHWCDYNVKYAVRIYGIKQDVDENGKKIGLTFGPAGGYGDSDKDEHTYVYCGDGTGGTYKNEKYKSCDNPNGCLHNMTWEEIVEKAKNSPDDFLPCLQNRCTHEIKLNITGPLAGTNYAGKMDDCDGASALGDSIASNYRKWNDINTVVGGYPDSKIRNTLTGATSEAIMNNGGNLTEDQSLFAMLPQILKDNIIAKKVMSCKSVDHYSFSSITTYDKLWLFSTREMYTTGYNTDRDYVHDEGELYQSQEYLNALSTEFVDSTTVNRFYNENNEAQSSLSRSVHHRSYSTWGTENITFFSTGYPNVSYNATAVYSLSPGFCIG